MLGLQADLSYVFQDLAPIGVVLDMVQAKQDEPSSGCIELRDLSTEKRQVFGETLNQSELDWLAEQINSFLQVRAVLL